MAVETHTLIVNPDAHTFHPDLMAYLRHNLESDHWLSVKTTTFLDGSPYAKVGGDIEGAAVVPLWVTGDIKTAAMRIMEIGNALSHEERGYEARTNHIVYVLPFVEGRADKISRVRTDVQPDEYDSLHTLFTADHSRRFMEGETVYAELLGQLVGGIGRAYGAILFEPHSALVHRYFQQNVPNVLTLTAAPLFAQWLTEHKYVDENTVVLAPDLGALSRAGHLAELLGVPLVIGDKWRPKHNVAQVRLRHGDIRGKRVIGYDDLIDSAGTIIEGARVFGADVSELIVVSTAAKFSGPAISRLDGALRSGLITKIVVTDTLPTAAKGKMLGGMGLEILPVGPILVNAVKTLLDDTATMDTYGIRPYLFRNETPEVAYRKHAGSFDLPMPGE